MSDIRRHPEITVEAACFDELVQLCQLLPKRRARPRGTSRRYTETELLAALYYLRQGITIGEVAAGFDRPRSPLASKLKDRFGDAYTEVIREAWRTPITRSRMRVAHKDDPQPKGGLRKGDQHSDEAKARISAANKGRKLTTQARSNISKGKQKRVVTPDGEFPSATRAAEHYSVCIATISYRTRHWSNWHFIPPTVAPAARAAGRAA